ncbi:MAG TPA: polysaccharide deacetylase family protein [bacterium]|jgi:peptidoglycan/xylan/chitin deacetylase (PgdA/CDA1 family)|nr:polysaccharide deacetylase family protein [bacterium]
MASNSKFTILIVGRLSGPKNQVILNILRQASVILQSFPTVRFQVVGGPVTEDHRRLEKSQPAIHFEGYQPSLKPYYQKATLVIGAGRVALEAMKLKKPVIAIGERTYVGPLRVANIGKAKATNFGDCFETESFDWEQLTKDILYLLRNSKARTQVAQTGYELLKAEYDMKRVYPQMSGLYEKVMLDHNLSQIHELPVLMYHQVLDKEPKLAKFNLHVLAADLEKQLQFLRDHGFETIVFEDLLTKRIPKKPVLLTFDDGYENNYHFLFPLLKNYRMKAVVYILADRKHKTNFWDKPLGEAEHKLLKPSQILEMQKSGWVEFGCHSLNHTRLTQLKKTEQEKQIAGSKKVLEMFLKRPVHSFAYPYGVFDEEIKKITQTAGYTFGLAVSHGPTQFQGDLLEIKRVHMFPQTSTFDFFKKTSGFYHRYRALLGR